jgi:exopolysaccharide biosynthesis polyprenyl glycosylphosphotransferase
MIEFRLVMRNYSDLVTKSALLLSDFLMVVGSFVAAYIIRVHWDDRALRDPVAAKTYIYIFLGLVPIWLLIFALLDLYKQKVYQSRVEEAFKLFFGSAIGIMVIIFADFLTDSPIYPSRLVPIYGFVIAFLALLLSRNIIHYVRSKLYKRGIGVKRTLVILAERNADFVGKLLRHQPTGHRIIGLFGMNENKDLKRRKIKVYKSIDSALAQINNREIDTILQVGMSENENFKSKILSTVQKHHLEYMIYPTFKSEITMQSHIEILDGQAILKINQTPLNGWWRIVKRTIDIFGSLAGLIVLSPVLLIIWLAIKITDPGPAIFKHSRVTRYGKKFEIYKFRSMYNKYSSSGSHNIEHRIKQFKEMGRPDLVAEFKKNNKVKNDPRITPLGRFLRGTSLDELPQLLNILKGDISIVGPRPVVKDELVIFDGAHEHLFLSIRPGLTGLWQVSGRSDLSNKERAQLDVYYVQNWSLLLDIKILLKTVAVVLRKTGSR